MDGISAPCGDSLYVGLSVMVTKKPFPFPFHSSSLTPHYPLFLHPLSISLLYPISTCDSHPFNTPYLCSHSTLPLYTPYLSSSLLFPSLLFSSLLFSSFLFSSLPFSSLLFSSLLFSSLLFSSLLFFFSSFLLFFFFFFFFFSSFLFLFFFVSYTCSCGMSTYFGRVAALTCWCC